MKGDPNGIGMNFATPKDVMIQEMATGIGEWIAAKIAAGEWAAAAIVKAPRFSRKANEWIADIEADGKRLRIRHYGFGRSKWKVEA